MAKLEPYRGDYYLWKYLPSIPAAAIFAALYFIITAAVAWRIWKTRSWFCTVFALGGLFEIIGYIARIMSRNNTAKLMPFAIQNAFILLAPVLFAASIYMVLSRIISSVNGERHSFIIPRWLTRIFVTGDVLALSIQSSAAGIMMISDLASLGEGVVIGGLAFHIVIFGIFGVTASRFHIKMRRDPMVGSIPASLQWEQLLRMLYASSALIMARSIFRIIEFIMGHDGYLLTTEWPLYVFDAVPMFTVMVIFWKWFPSAVQKSNVDGYNDRQVELIAPMGNTSQMLEQVDTGKREEV